MSKLKIVFFLVNLEIGGIETSFINLINNLDLNKYELYLVLEHKTGPLLRKIPKEIKIIDYNLNESKIVIYRKIRNRLKYIKNIILNRKKFDVAINYCHYSDLFPKLALKYGKKSVLWIHTNLVSFIKKDECLNYFKKKKFHRYDTLVFVSQTALNDYQKIVSSKQECIVCRNFIRSELQEDSRKIVKPDKFIFLNVSRHHEQSKKISRIIEATRILSKKIKNFEVWLVGDGPDSKMYSEMIKKYKLGNTIKMLGAKSNPFPYYRACDVVLMSSEYEGFPVVYCECIANHKHLITTDVSDAKYIFDSTQATIVNGNPQDYANAMMKVMEQKEKYNEFNIDKFNNEIIESYNKIFCKKQ